MNAARNLITVDSDTGSETTVGPATAEQIEASDAAIGNSGLIWIDTDDGSVIRDGSWEHQDAKARGTLAAAYVAL